jgi:glyoxylase-like metal-dependent hydrolase (beta-lactamase superfamily II)
MRIEPIQTGTVAVKRRQRAGVGSGKQRLAKTFLDREWTEPLPIYAWLIEHPEGIVVVDTGETARASQPGYFPSWHPYFRGGLREWVTPDEEIGPQLERRGVSPSEVRWLVMTHLHTDHAGGLGHFRQSEVFVSRREMEDASGLTGRMRGYLNNRFPDWFEPRPVDFQAEPFATFSESVCLTSAGDIRLVPTPGHTPGHLSVIVEDEEDTVFLAGDASYTEELMLRGVVDGVAPDEEAARETLVRTRRLADERELVYLPSHDPGSGGRLAARVPVHAQPSPSPA